MSAATPPASAHRRSRWGLADPVAAKVPVITVLFWVVKVLTTGMGEATSDYLAAGSLAVAGAAGLLGFAVALWLQFRTDRYRAWAYWFAVAMVAVFGTMAADALHKIVGLPYPVTSTFYAIVVAAVFYAWWRSEGTLSVHSITTRRREVFYWCAVLGTFALGTAVGDLTAFTLHLGYLPSAVLFLAAMAIPAIGWARGTMNPVLAFWFAYVLTRPLGASLADWLGKPAWKSGLDLGDGRVALTAAVLIAGLVWFLARSGERAPAGVAQPGAASGAPGRGAVPDFATE